jgi:hypothetical protein
MINDDIWQALRNELLRWEKANRIAQFWLRDDDAIEPTSALERLLGLANVRSVPLTLAIIPAGVSEALSERLVNESRVTVAVHGWEHQNHAGASEKKQELGGHRPLHTVLRQLEAGYSLLKQKFPGRFVPVLVPPWNRIGSNIIPHLSKLGFQALSVFGLSKSEQTTHLRVINTHVDIIDWHGTRGCRDHSELIAEIVRELQRRFSDGDEPVGILTHHLVHDVSAWDFLAQLFKVTTDTTGCQWVSIRDLLRDQSPENRVQRTLL